MASQRLEKFTASSLIVSGIGFLIGEGCLYLALGPGSPDLLPALAQSGGQRLFEAMIWTFSIGAIFLLIASVGLGRVLSEYSIFGARLVTTLATVIAPLFISFLSLQFGLVFIARRGIVPTDTAYNQISMLTHAAADISGMVAIALVVLIILLIGYITRHEARWRYATYFGIFISVIAVGLFVLESSFLFLAVAALWEFLVAVTLMRSSKGISKPAVFHTSLR